jgi:hypothetical protein
MSTTLGAGPTSEIRRQTRVRPIAITIDQALVPEVRRSVQYGEA